MGRRYHDGQQPLIRIDGATALAPLPSRAQVLTLVDQITAGASPSAPWRVFVTGHSLGGAIATLCAFELAGRK